MLGAAALAVATGGSASADVVTTYFTDPGVHSFVVPADTRFDVVNDGDGPLRMLCCLPVGGQARTDDATFTPPWAE